MIRTYPFIGMGTECLTLVYSSGTIQLYYGRFPLLVNILPDLRGGGGFYALCFCSIFNCLKCPLFTTPACSQSLSGCHMALILAILAFGVYLSPPASSWDLVYCLIPWRALCTFIGKYFSSDSCSPTPGILFTLTWWRLSEKVLPSGRRLTPWPGILRILIHHAGLCHT